MSSNGELARIAYKAYAGSTGGLTFDGRKMPPWESLPEKTVMAWCCAALAVKSVVTVEERRHGVVHSE